MQKITGFIKEVRLEMAHVKWPTRQETIWLTATVIVVCVGTAYLLGFFDFAFSTGLTKLLAK